MPDLKSHLKILFLSACLFLLALVNTSARDYNVTGKVTDAKGGVVANAKVSLAAGTIEFLPLQDQMVVIP